MGQRNWTSDPDCTEPDLDLQARIESERPLLLALARRLTRDEHDAQDAVQDALERAWRARRQLRSPAAAGGWMRSILARSVIDGHRRTTSLPDGQAELIDGLLPDVQDPATVLAAAQEEMTLRAALRTLAPADRIAVVLHDAEGWQAAQLAELLGISTDAANKRVQRARTRLINALAGPEASTLNPVTSACRDARAHSHALLDGTLDDATRIEVQQHLDTCPSCPAALQAAAGVLSALQSEHGAIPVAQPLRGKLDELVKEADEAP